MALCGVNWLPEVVFNYSPENIKFSFPVLYCILITFLSLSPAVVEHVRDGSTVRVILLPSYTYLFVAMSGVKVSSRSVLIAIVQKIGLGMMDGDSFYESKEHN